LEQSRFLGAGVLLQSIAKSAVVQGDHLRDHGQFVKLWYRGQFSRRTLPPSYGDRPSNRYLQGVVLYELRADFLDGRTGSHPCG
jgi:hypothetical protein